MSVPIHTHILTVVNPGPSQSVILGAIAALYSHPVITPEEAYQMSLNACGWRHIR